MGSVSNYILGIGSAALLFGILTSLTDRKTAAGLLIRIACGICLGITLIGPVCDLKIANLTDILEDYTRSGETAAADGERIAAQTKKSLILDRVQKYILDKADSLGATLDVTVSVSDDTLIPDTVCITGDISPYAKYTLQKQIEEDLGIAKEQQIWNGS